MSPALELEVDPLARREAGDDVGQQPGRDGDRAVGLDLARDPVGDPDLEVRRRQLEAGVLGPDEDVGEDRQRAPARHRAADDRQAAGEVLLHDRDVHERFTPGRRVWSPGARPADERGEPARRLDSGDRSGDRRWVSLHILERHHHHHAVDGVDAPRSPGRELGVHGRRPPVDRHPLDGGRGRDGLWANGRPAARTAPGAAGSSTMAAKTPGARSTTGRGIVHNATRFSTEFGAVIHRKGQIGARTHRRPHRSDPHRTGRRTPDRTIVQSA